jgi:hypothetical protein
MNNEKQPIIPDNKIDKPASASASDSVNDFDAQLGTPIDIEIQEADDFSKKLDIQYPVLYYVRNFRGTAQIITDISSKRHLIFISPFVNESKKDYVPDIAHELCHAKFSEQLDPIFSTVRFSRKYGQLSGDEYAEFSKKAPFVELCQSYVDIWINDLRFEIDPKLTQEENDQVISFANKAVESDDRSIITDPRKIISIAMVLAEQKRHKLRMPKILKIMKAYGNEWKKVTQLRDMMLKLPHLTDGKGNFLPEIRDLAINSLEENAKRVSDILNCPIIPFIIDEPLIEGGEEKIKVWDFEKRE